MFIIKALLCIDLVNWTFYVFDCHIGTEAPSTEFEKIIFFVKYFY